jgi:hypothetical protein
MHLLSYLMTRTFMMQSKASHISASKSMYPSNGPSKGAIISKFRASGQTCICANRIYVQSSVYAEFASRLAQKVAAFRVGDGLDENTYVFAFGYDNYTLISFPRSPPALTAL